MFVESILLNDRSSARLESSETICKKTHAQRLRWTEHVKQTGSARANQAHVKCVRILPWQPRLVVFRKKKKKKERNEKKEKIHKQFYMQSRCYKWISPLITLSRGSWKRITFIMKVEWLGKNFEILTWSFESQKLLQENESESYLFPIRVAIDPIPERNLTAH